MTSNPPSGSGNQSGRGLTVHMSVILTAIWTGMVGYQAYAKYMIHDELFVLGALGLVIGAVLTIVAMLWVIKLADIASRSPHPIVIKALAPPPSVAPPAKPRGP